MAAGPLWQDHGLIFTSETGAPLDPENLSRAFAKLCNRPGLATGTRTSCGTRAPR